MGKKTSLSLTMFMVFMAIICVCPLEGRRDDELCNLPPQVGYCRASFPRFFYNPTSMACEEFDYGGCDGNGNNFKTQAECKESCVCNLPKDEGPCFGALHRFFYNPNSLSCEKFEYGGCGGNANNFETQAECKESCVCNLPKKEGFCRAAFSRFFYNPDSKSCEEFTYGGCDGNANNFETIDTCQQVCGP